MSVPKQPKTVAVVVPLSNRRELTPDEEISFRHLVYFLGKYDKYLVVPNRLRFDYPGFGKKRFPDRFFGTVAAHTKLLLSAGFYNAFSEYKYILIYHPDALVFSDELLQWCDTDLDYIGPPFIQSDDSPWVKGERVGNGGFSLRKVESFLKVIYSGRYAVDPKDYWTDFCVSKPKYIQYLNTPRKYVKRLGIFNNARWEIARWHLVDWHHEDHFWSDRATQYYPGFKIPSVETGLRFGFEAAPRKAFELNNRRFPFGCHAWPRYDRKFWEPYLLT